MVRKIGNFRISPAGVAILLCGVLFGCRTEPFGDIEKRHVDALNENGVFMYDAILPYNDYLPLDTPSGEGAAKYLTAWFRYAPQDGGAAIFSHLTHFTNIRFVIVERDWGRRDDGLQWGRRDDNIFRWLKSLPRLGQLRIDGIPLSDGAVAQLREKRSLVALELLNTTVSVSENMLQSISQIPHLEALSITSLPHYYSVEPRPEIEVLSLRHLAKLDRLRVLSLDGTCSPGRYTPQELNQALNEMADGIGDTLRKLSFALDVENDFSFLARLPGLEVLGIDDMSGKGLQHAWGLHLLEEVVIASTPQEGSLSGGCLTDMDLRQALSHWPGIRKFGLHASSGVSGKALAGLSAPELVSEVLFWNCPDIDDSLFDAVARMTGLEKLEVGNSPKLTGMGMGKLANCRNLVELQLAGCGINDNSLLSLRTDTPLALKRLDVSTNQVTGKGLARIVDLLRPREDATPRGPKGWLIFIDATSTRVTPEEANEIMARRPDVGIAVDQPAKREEGIDSIWFE